MHVQYVHPPVLGGCARRLADSPFHRKWQEGLSRWSARNVLYRARMRLGLTLVALGSMVTVARAEVTRCSQASVDLSYTADDLPDASGDTGWFPGGSPAQLRITGQLAGLTKVAMGLAPTACWDAGPMALTVTGQPQTGLLDSEYGADLLVYAQIHTSVLGIGINWSGQIPITALPTDFLVAGQTGFDPTVLPDSDQPVISVTSNPTSPIKLISTDVLSSIIDITGLSGGVSITVQGQMTTSYITNDLQVAGGSVTSVTGSVPATRPDTGFGKGLTVSMAADGDVFYEPSLIFDAKLYISIFGIHVVNWTVASVTLPLPSIDRSVTLTGTDVTIPLPHMDPVPTSLGFASGSVQQLQIHNAGSAPLQLEVGNAPDGVTASPVTIAPGSDGTVQVTAADPSMVSGQTLVFETNDPEHAQLAIALDGTHDGQGSDGQGLAEASGCGGCSSHGGTGGGLLVIAAIGLVCVRRRPHGAMRTIFASPGASVTDSVVSGVVDFVAAHTSSTR